MKSLSRSVLIGFLVVVIVLISFSAMVNAKNPTLIPPLPPVAQNDPFFGIVQAIHDPDKAVRAGVRWERLVVWWSNFQPNGPDEWVSDAWFARNLIDFQKGRNIEPVGVILHTPIWAAQDEGYRHISPPKNLDLPFDHPDNYWGQFLMRLADEYAGTVDTWILWNEPDIYKESFANWAGTLDEFTRMQIVGYKAIKKANPNAKVILTGTTYWWDVQHERTLYLDRLVTELKNAPGAKQNGAYFDAVAVHQYNNPLNSYTVPVLYRRVLQKHGLNKPLWLIESNTVPHDDPIGPLHRGGLRASMEEQANYMIQSVALARAAGVERYSVYKMRDEGAENEQYYGLVRNDGTPRPAYVAYQTAVRELSNTQDAVYFWNNSGSPPTEDEITALLATTTEYEQFVWPGALNGVRMKRGADRVTVLWNASAAPLEVGVPSSIKRAKVVNKYGEEQWIDRQADGAFHLTLAAATNNTESRDLQLILVAGDPIILVEPGAATIRDGLPRLLNDACWGVPGASIPPNPTGKEGWVAPTGYAVSGPWQGYYDGRGGVDHIGYPRSPLIQDPLDDEKCVQYYQRLVLEWHPDNPPDDRIQRRLLTRELTGLPPAAPSEPERENGHDYWYFANGSNGLGHPVMNIIELEPKTRATRTPTATATATPRASPRDEADAEEEVDEGMSDGQEEGETEVEQEAEQENEPLVQPLVEPLVQAENQAEETIDEESDYTIRVYIGFKDYFDNNGKEGAFGYPMEPPVQHVRRNGTIWWSQRFQAAIFEYYPKFGPEGLKAGSSHPWQKEKFQIKKLGDEYIIKHNLPIIIDDPSKVIPKPPQPTPR